MNNSASGRRGGVAVCRQPAGLDVRRDEFIEPRFEHRSLARPNVFTLAGLTSIPTTECPNSDKHAAETDPTYPSPNTANRIDLPLSETQLPKF
jgi:hypothetical protein